MTIKPADPLYNHVSRNHTNYSISDWVEVMEKIDKLPITTQFLPFLQQEVRFERFTPDQMNRVSHFWTTHHPHSKTSLIFFNSGLPNTPKALNPKELSTHLTNTSAKSDINLARLLIFAHQYAISFNPIHWAIFAEKLFEANKIGIDLTAHKIEIDEILAFLPSAKEGWTGGVVAQVIGGLAPILDRSSENFSFLLKKLSSFVEEMDDREKNMITIAIRKENRRTLTPFVEILIGQPIQQTGLFAATLHCCGRLRVTRFKEQWHEFLPSRIDDFTAKELAEVLQGLKYFNECRPASVDPKLIGQIVKSLITKIDQLEPEDQKRAILQISLSLFDLDFANDQWINLSIQKAFDLKLPVWDKITLANHLKFNPTPSFKKFVEEIGKELIQPEHDLRRSKYSSDGFSLLSLIITHTENTTVGQALMEKYRPYAKTMQEGRLLEKAQSTLSSMK